MANRASLGNITCNRMLVNNSKSIHRLIKLLVSIAYVAMVIYLFINVNVRSITNFCFHISWQDDPLNYDRGSCQENDPRRWNSDLFVIEFRTERLHVESNALIKVKQASNGISQLRPYWQLIRILKETCCWLPVLNINVLPLFQSRR